MSKWTRQSQRRESVCSPAAMGLDLTLLLLVLGILADDHDAALALDDLALFADGLYGRSHFHDDITSYLNRIAPAVQPFG